jgi:hypothetical protein
MKRLVLIVCAWWLAGCATEPVPMPYTPSVEAPAPHADPNQNLISALGMNRAPADLGFSEKAFNPCSFGLNGTGGCGDRYFTVVHFQLLCRDTEGTVSEAPLRLQPIVTDNVRWKVAGLTGGTRTDSNGYGQLTVMSNRSTRGQRLLLHIGPQFVAFDVSEVSKIVLPKNFCRS